MMLFVSSRYIELKTQELPSAKLRAHKEVPLQVYRGQQGWHNLGFKPVQINGQPQNKTFSCQDSNMHSII